MENIAKTVSGQTKGTEAYERAQQQAVKDNRNANLIAALSALGVSTGTGFLVNKLQDQNILGGLINKNVNTNTQSARNLLAANQCRQAVNTAKSKLNSNRSLTIDASAHKDLIASANLVSVAISKIKDYGKSGSLVGGIIENVSDKCKADNTMADCENALNEADLDCQFVVDSKGEYDIDNKQDNTRRWVSIGAAGVAGVGTFFAVRKLTRDIKSEKLTAAQQEAYDQFMREVGNHIYCFIGADEAGTYGDLIEISID